MVILNIEVGSFYAVFVVFLILMKDRGKRLLWPRWSTKMAGKLHLLSPISKYRVSHPSPQNIYCTRIKSLLGLILCQLEPLPIRFIYWFNLLFLISAFWLLTEFYSDVLYNQWYCSNVDLSAWANYENIDRRSNLTLEEFVEQYEKPNRPVIITDVVPKWVFCEISVI